MNDSNIKYNVTSDKSDNNVNCENFQKHVITKKFKHYLASFDLMLPLYYFYNLPMTSCNMLV